jgi:hypothetical protein
VWRALIETRFDDTYRINPWMDPQAWAESGQALHGMAKRQWAALRRILVCKGGRYANEHDGG